jgi:hypothetical protein
MQVSQGMARGMTSQHMQMGSQPPSAAPGMTTQGLQAQQQSAMLMQRVSSAQHVVPGQQQQPLMAPPPASGAGVQQMGGMSLPMQQPGMMQPPQMMAGQLQQHQQQQMGMGAPVSLRQATSGQMQGMQQPGVISGTQQPNPGSQQPHAGA